MKQYQKKLTNNQKEAIRKQYDRVHSILRPNGIRDNSQQAMVAWQQAITNYQVAILALQWMTLKANGRIFDEEQSHQPKYLDELCQSLEKGIFPDLKGKWVKI